ncbi:hypothetical protein ACC734_39960, partial [Rhizobium ruizarguesonis]
DSPKGVIALVRPVNAVVEDNTLTGGGFGISAQAGKNVAIRDNDISVFHGYSWSFAVGLAVMDVVARDIVVSRIASVA